MASALKDLLSPLEVHGTVRRVNGTGVARRDLIAFDIDLRSRQELGRACTDASGKYSIKYTRASFARAEKRSADIRIVVAPAVAEGTPKQSPILFNAPDVATIDIVIDGDEVIGPSEFAALVDAISPVLDGVDISDLGDEDQEFLVGETGVDAANLKTLVTAHQHAAKSKLPAAFFYGLMRQGQPSDFKPLSAVPGTQITVATRAAMAANIIDQKSEKDVEIVVKKLGQVAVSISAGQSIDGAEPPPLGKLLKLAVPNPGPFVQALATTKATTITEFWKSVAEHPDTKSDVEKLQFGVQLGGLLLNHVPLVTEILQQQKIGKIKNFTDLASFSEKHWQKLIDDPKIGVPEGIPGEGIENKKKTYVMAISRVMEESLPMKFFTARLIDEDDDEVFGELPGKDDVHTFLKNNPTFDFKTSFRVADLFDKDPSLLTGVKDPDRLKTLISGAQRLQAIAPRYSLIRPLLTDGVDSSLKISRMGETVFMAKYGTLLGKGDALEVFDRAQQTHSTAFSLLANYGPVGDGLKSDIFQHVRASDLPKMDGMPNWADLFGSADMCSCDGCRAMDSPAAYLVDVLHFLKDRRIPDMKSIVRDVDSVKSIKFKKWRPPGSTKSVEMNAKDVLFQRRGDIGEIELTCENTNTPLPYIDLVIEILENEVSPPPPFIEIDLPEGTELDLNSRDLDDVRDKFSPPLSEYATVEVIKPSVRWSIHEPEYTYTVVQKELAPKVTMRSRQTIGTRQERAAEPQYMNFAAYEHLAKAVYPWNLPYNLSLETVWTYLAHLTVNRLDIMQAFSPLTRTAALTDLPMVYETLHLSANEAGIINGTTTGQADWATPGVWNFWGFESEMVGDQSWSEILAGRVDTFLERAQLKYVDLLNLLEVGIVFGGENLPQIAAIPPASDSTCQLDKLRLVRLGPRALERMARFIRLWRKLDGWSIIELAKTVRVLAPLSTSEYLGDGFLTRLSHVVILKKELDLPVETILAFFSPLSMAEPTDHSDDDESKPISQYARIFHNGTLFGQPSTVFTDDPSTLSGTISENSETIIAALNISSEELSLLLAAKIVPDSLTLANLSLLYRHTVLAKALDISVRDWLALLKIVPETPFVDTASTVIFMERALDIVTSDFTIPELSYILRNDYVDGAGIGPTDAEIAPVLDELRTGLNKITIENTLSPEMTDAKGDKLKKKLALLNLEPGILTQFMGTLSNTTPYDVYLPQALPESFAFPAALRDKINYDPVTNSLSFSSVMTEEEKTALLATSGITSQISDAVSALFEAPRTFLRRNFTTYFPYDYTTTLAVMPSTVQIPAALQGKVYHDPDAELLHAKGALTSSERDSLLSGIDPVANNSYVDAVNFLYNQPGTLTLDQADVFLSQSDIAGLYNAKLDSKGAITPQRRFEFVLRKLLPKLLDTLSYQFFVQKFSGLLGIDTTVADLVLKQAKYPGTEPIHQIFRTSLFATSSLKFRSTPAVFGPQFQAFALLRKMALVISKFNLSVKQLNWLFSFRSLPNDPTVAWLQLDKLPLAKLETAGAQFTAWNRLSALVKLRDSLPNGATVLDLLFKWARDPSKPVDEVYEYLDEQLQWTREDVKYLLGPNVLNTPYPGAFKDEVALGRILRCVNLAKTTNLSVANTKLLAEPNQKETQARIVVRAVKSKYDQTTWDSVARPLRNILRDGQRQALVAFILANQAFTSWKNANDLFAHFLMDVEMGPCQLTSRIKAAIGSVQLFVQRCLMRLESEVTANSEVDSHWDEWAWMKSQPVHAANYRVLMYPENYMEPSLRDNQTSFYKDFLNELQQTELTEITAEKAFGNYLNKLAEVSRLEVVSVYHDKEPDLTGHLRVDEFHVIARTRAHPHHYFHRKRIDSVQWNPGFEPIDADIGGDHVFPVIWNRRFLLFWAVFERKQPHARVKMPQPGNEVDAEPSYWQIKLAWSEFVDGKWLAKQLSTKSIAVWGFAEDFPGPADQGRKQLTFRSAISTEENTLQIACYLPKQEFGIVQGKITFRANSGFLGAFEFDGVHSMPQVVKWDWADIKGLGVFGPHDTHINNMSWEGEWPYQSVRLMTNNLGQIPKAEDYYQQYTDLELLYIEKGMDGPAYSLVSASEEEAFGIKKPFFFQRGLESFFVEPREVPRHVIDSVDPSPFVLDGHLVAAAIDKLYPLIPEFDAPYPPPFRGGALRYPVSGPIGRQIFKPATLATKPITTRQAQLVANPLTSKLGRSVQASLEVRGINTIPLPISSPIYTPFQFKYSTFHHSFVKDFITNLNRDGIDGLLQRAVQFLGEDKRTFRDTYGPNPFMTIKDRRGQYAENVVDFEDGSYAVYNWELFFHIPFMLADRLSKSQRFAEAQKWFHYIFDPTDTSTDFPKPARYWRTKKFAETQSEQYALESLPQLFEFLAKKRSGEELSPEAAETLRAFEDNVRQWRKEPFNPFLIARTRTTAFQKDVVMRYLDNIIAWGDSLFRQDTIEKINEATQLYILAAEILGRRPQEIPPRAIPEVQTYNSLEPKLDSLGNALVNIEEMVPPNTSNQTISPKKSTQAIHSSMLFFCVPRNDKLLSYWDTVSDRLFKIRNCMNLQGIVRELALWDPPIDPMLLVKAVASGVDISSALSDLNAPLPLYRFRVWHQRAVDLTNELRNLGSALISAIEKKDSEALSLMRSQHEQAVNDAMNTIKKKHIEEATASLESVKRTKETVNERYLYYSSRENMNAEEKTSMDLEKFMMSGLAVEAAALFLSGQAFVYPEGKLGAPTSVGATYGGTNIGKAAQLYAAFVARNSALAKQVSTMAITKAAYSRRMDDWQLQARLAQKELAQLDQQIAAAEVRLAVAEEEQKMHALQTKNTKEIDDFMRRQKFSNRELFSWMQGELTTLYFQHYGMAYDAAKRAERAYCWELGLPQANFIKFGYWDGLKKGLLAAEKLMIDLKAMEVAYLEENRRDYEITTNISLAQLDPLALIQLRENQEAFFALPEAIFDMDYPGHYMRRIKSVSLTIPCVVGPYTSVCCTLSLFKGTLRISNGIAGGKYSRLENDIRFSDDYGQFESVVTSTAQNDSGLFALNFEDQRYLPFEGAGVISNWRIQLNKNFRQFDYSTISDVIVHVRYTAREGGEILRNLASSDLKTQTLKAISMAEGQNGLARMLSLRAEYPSHWYRLWNPPSADGKQEMTIDLSSARFPYIFREANIKIEKIQVFVFVRKDFLASHNATSLELRLVEAAAPIPDVPPAALALAPYSDRQSNSVFRAAKPFAAPAGAWKLSARLKSGARVDPGAIEDVVLVCHFSVRY